MSIGEQTHCWALRRDGSAEAELVPGYWRVSRSDETALSGSFDRLGSLISHSFGGGETKPAGAAE